ncbi:DUF6933 domain-containing protein [Maridesulfovibrio ferrireducens]|uniref:DUF6933 domain-containing protein n=1 Tax=Maridesulfovibrio ferrireducens TaxID=246191 RepID=UPI000B8060F5
MLYMGCTKKLLDEFKIKESAEKSDLRGLRGWHGNTFLLYRSKAALLVNDGTIFAVFIPRLCFSVAGTHTGRLTIGACLAL